MSPRRFLNMVRSPAGALVLFLIGLGLLLLLINSRDSAPTPKHEAARRNAPTDQQVAHSVEREITPFRPAVTPTKPERLAVPAAAESGQQKFVLPSLSIVTETPTGQSTETETSENYVPFGRLIPCELIITVDSSSIQTPIVGLVSEDVFHHGVLVIPAGTEVHGRAQVDRVRERIASDGRWTLVWQSGESLGVSGIALDHERGEQSGTWSLTDGSAGLRGRLIKSDNLAELKLYAASLLSGAGEVFTDRTVSGFGSFTMPTLKNAPLKGAQSIMDRYAQQILATIERDGFYVRVPAGKRFYLYLTQTLDRANAKIGSAESSSREPLPAPQPTRQAASR
jgi:Bacterial conjugation TrbI-like protein